MTVVVTRDVADRFRGFLASCMLEIAPGVYTASRMNNAVRERVWTVMEDWFGQLGGGAIVMVWREPKLPAGQSVRVLGEPPVELIDVDGVILSRRPLTEAEKSNLSNSPAHLVPIIPQKEVKQKNN
ncbi:MAG: type I-E CRISPR-associated endoribonuclease Cas2 [Magnetococcales bacterium]|nr:type I-E CRISPR-associated endoribonuclease Cas2 [Magnetococcales bacterium]MBF0323100.1 type I-E CRISPR-associated endoribonuclease Cas2 [Magnetococcales bacterium]